MDGIKRVGSKHQYIPTKNNAESGGGISWSVVYLASSVGFLCSLYYVHYKNRRRLLETCRSYRHLCERKNAKKNAQILTDEQLLEILDGLAYVKLRILASDPNKLRKLVYKENNVDAIFKHAPFSV